MMTTGNIGDNRIPKRMNVGAPHNFLEKDKLVKKALMKFEKTEKTKEDKDRLADTIHKIMNKMK